MCWQSNSLASHSSEGEAFDLFLGAIIYVVLTRMKDGIHLGMQTVKQSLSRLNNLNRVKRCALTGFGKKIIKERILIPTGI